MSSPMVDCRSLIEFCRAFEQHRNSLDRHNNQNQSRNKKHSSNSLHTITHPLCCDQSPFAAIDVIILCLVLTALGVLTLPYFKFIFHEAFRLLPPILLLFRDVIYQSPLIGDAIYQAPLAYAVALVVMFVTVATLWEILSHQARKCGNPYCKGLRKAVEFDIQLESEECVKYMPTIPKDVFGACPLELGQDHKELEAELKRMAPLNGRTVLIFRAPCGCPAALMTSTLGVLSTYIIAINIYNCNFGGSIVSCPIQSSVT